jgi:hypothetical protein
MGVYDRQIATAQRLIKEKGQTIIWRSMTDGAPSDSDQPWKPSAATQTDYMADVLFLPRNRRNQEFLSLMEGIEVPKGDIVGYMGGVTFTPTLKDTIIRGGETYTIASLDHLSPNGESILWVMGLER